MLNDIEDQLRKVLGWLEQQKAASGFPEALSALIDGVHEVLQRIPILPPLPTEEFTYLALCFDELAYAMDHYAEAHDQIARNPSHSNGA